MPPTFSQVLSKSEIFREVNQSEIEAEKFLEKSAKFFVERDGDFDLSSPEVSALLKKAEELFPIEKPGSISI